MKKIILLISLLCSTSLFAFTEVSCWDNSCLENGWSSYNINTSVSTSNICYREGCEKSGWIIGLGARRFYTQCKGAGCFIDGWYDIDMNTQNLRAEVLCLNGSCFDSGWTVYTRTGLQELVTCTEGNCREKGWAVQSFNGAISIVTCKPLGCFVEGWIQN